MKTLLLSLSLVATMTSFAHASDPAGFTAKYLMPVTLSPLLPFAASSALSSISSSEKNVHKLAEQIMRDGQEYLQTKEMTILIAKNVEQLQEEQDMSDDEAVDALMNQASVILN